MQKKEIIVFEGTINSAQLLMLSWIGHREHLNKFNIPVIQDLLVGDNLHNIPQVPLYFHVINQSSLIRPTLSIENLYKFFVHGTGSLLRTAAFFMLFNFHCNRN